MRSASARSLRPTGNVNSFVSSRELQDQPTVTLRPRMQAESHVRHVSKALASRDRIDSLQLKSRVAAADLSQSDETILTCVVDDADEIGGILGPELRHDARPMNLDGARTDPELTAGLLAGSAGHDLGEHVLIAPSQGLATGKGEG